MLRLPPTAPGDARNERARIAAAHEAVRRARRLQAQAQAGDTDALARAHKPSGLDDYATNAGQQRYAHTADQSLG